MFLKCQPFFPIPTPHMIFVLLKMYGVGWNRNLRPHLMVVGENVKGRRIRVVWTWGRVRWAWNRLKKKNEFCIEWSAGQHCGRAGRQRKLEAEPMPIELLFLYPMDLQENRMLY